MVLKGGSTFEIEDPAMVKFYKQGPASDPAKLSQGETATNKNLYMSAAHRQSVRVVSRHVSKDDWLEWYRRRSIELLKESPSPALRSCWTVAQHYVQLTRALFNASFVACWREMEASQQNELMAPLEQALVAYRRREAEQEGEDTDPEVLLGQMRGMEALGKWSQLHTPPERCWSKGAPDTRQSMARMASTAAWGRDEWASMEQSVVLQPRDNQDGAFYSAVQSVHSLDWRVGRTGRGARKRSPGRPGIRAPPPSPTPTTTGAPSPEPTSFPAQVVQQRRGQLPAGAGKDK